MRLAEQQGVPSATPEDLRGIPEDVLGLLPAKVAKRCHAIAFQAQRDPGQGGADRCPQPRPPGRDLLRRRQADTVVRRPRAARDRSAREALWGRVPRAARQAARQDEPLAIPLGARKRRGHRGGPDTAPHRRPVAVGLAHRRSRVAGARAGVAGRIAGVGLGRAAAFSAPGARPADACTRCLAVACRAAIPAAAAAPGPVAPPAREADSASAYLWPRRPPLGARRAPSPAATRSRARSGDEARDWRNRRGRRASKRAGEEPPTAPAPRRVSVEETESRLLRPRERDDVARAVRRLRGRTRRARRAVRRAQGRRRRLALVGRRPRRRPPGGTGDCACSNPRSSTA